MSAIKVFDKYFVPYISASAIQDRIGEIARQINDDYKGKKPIFIAILNGSFMFASDLFRKITLEAEIHFIKLASYEGTHSTGKIKTAIGLSKDLNGRDVIVIEDIVDTGHTMGSFLPEVRKQQPASLKLCTLLHKPDATIIPVPVDYYGFKIPNKFVLGYGLDYNQLGRNLPELYQLEGE